MVSSEFQNQAYITLHPVSVEGQEISAAFSTEGLNLQQAVLSQTGISGDVSLELNPHVSLTDVKGLQLSAGTDVSSQVSFLCAFKNSPGKGSHFHRYAMLCPL